MIFCSLNIENINNNKNQQPTVQVFWNGAPVKAKMRPATLPFDFTKYRSNALEKKSRKKK